MPAITVEDLNQQYALFWADQAELLKQRMANDTVRAVALGMIRDQELVGMPLQQRLTLEKALESAEKIGERFSAAWSRKGGKAKKSDPLQLLIEQVVQKRPSITVRQLERKLRNHQGIDPIVDIDNKLITFVATNGNLKEAKMSGLKHRLSRAKKKLKSR